MRCAHRNPWMIGKGMICLLWCPKCGSLRHATVDADLTTHATGKWIRPKNESGTMPEAP